MTSTTTLPARPYSYYDDAAGYRPSDSAMPPSGAPARARLDQMRFWVGAGITAVVAALAGVVGLVVTHGIVHVPVLAQDHGALTTVNAVTYGLIAAGIALVAAALYNAMLHVAPRPALYYCWLTGLLTVLATLIPFTMASAQLSSQVALAGMNLLVGLVIVIMVPFAAQSATTRS
jgi:Family of unknown function (DUF6069)